MLCRQPLNKNNNNNNNKEKKTRNMKYLLERNLDNKHTLKVCKTNINIHLNLRFTKPPLPQPQL